MISPGGTSGDAEILRKSVLRNGSEVWIRPISGADKDRLASAFRRLSQISRERRFLGPALELSPEDLSYLTDVDHRRHEALVALDGETSDIVGVARYVRTPGTPESGEVAVAVLDDWQNRGLATELLTRLTERARENGLRRYSALVSKDNTVVLDLLDRLGATRFGATEAGEIEFAIELPALGLGERLGDALRAAAAGRPDMFDGIVRRLASWKGG